jgi:hypothetical protein
METGTSTKENGRRENVKEKELTSTKKMVDSKKLFYPRLQSWDVVNKTKKSFSNLAASPFCFSRSNKSTTTLQFLFLQGCVIVALQGCVIVAL